MKKFLGLTMLLLSLAGTCFANSSIEITYAKVPGVLNFATEFYAAMNAGFQPIKKTDDSTILAAKQKTTEGQDVVKQVLLKAKQEADNVQLSIESVLIKTNAQGKPQIEKVEEPGQERSLLAAVKNVFNDHYYFGYVLSNEYKEGGFVIDSLDMGSAAKEAGMKPGDILIQVNKKAIAQTDEGLFNDKVLPSCFTGKETEFTVLRDGDALTFKVTPILELAMLKQ